MGFRSWELSAWPQVRWSPPRDPAQWPEFHHIGTSVRAERDELGRVVGDTAWAVELDEGQVVGAAWEWVQLLPSVLALRDPNGVLSNAYLVDGEGERLDEAAGAVALNVVAHRTGWQVVVNERLARRQGPGLTAVRGAKHRAEANRLVQATRASRVLAA